MMSKILDFRGLGCPKPVMETRKALQSENVLTVIVDSRAARENVSRLASRSGCQVRIEEKDNEVYIHIEREGDAQAQEKSEPESSTQATSGSLALVIASDTVGSGDDELGRILMRAFMTTFLEVEPRPDIIIFMNNGVRLAISDSPVLDDLQVLANEGVEILICGTCLNYFGLTDRVVVGEISNAYTIAETMLQARKIVRL
jgi:selenium metabolism protein YedF